MDEVIAGATGLINEILKSSSEFCSDFTKSQLINTRNDLNRLLEPDSTRTDWSRLLCRQLKRYLDYNNSLTNDFWIEMHNDILYVLEESNGGQNKGSSWKSFLEKMNLENGLDEIPDVGQRGEIVDLVRKFIDEYVRAPNFISAFDEEMLHIETLFNWNERIFEIKSPYRSGGNQIVVTSRIVGYQLHPLSSPSIMHYSLCSMNNDEAKKFITKWMLQVEEAVFEVLRREILEMFGKTVKNLSQKRCNAIEAVFENCSELLKSSPSLLSLICISIFQSSNEFHFKSRIEVYHYVVQSTLHSWRKAKPSISESVLFKFLIDLAVHLHLQSSSGLIDAFDMEHLCCSTLKQLRLFNDRRKLLNYAKKLISLLDFNVGIVAERGLQIFGFQHLTFQEYFVAQFLVRESSIEEIAERIRLFTINPRFRESLLLALGWISWKWSLNNYDKFYNLLITPTKDYAIPFGTLLFFDAFNDLQKLPSKTVIFTALNSLLDHPSNLTAATYLIPNLSKLHEYIIIEWMQLHLKDEKRLLKFCQCLIRTMGRSSDENKIDSKSIPAVVYQQLWSLHYISTSAQFIIDQILRRIVSLDNFPNDVFTNELCSHVLSQNIFIDNIHPLILSVIIAVCGGIHFKSEKDTRKISFSPKRMHRQSSIITPIIEYLTNNETHSIKIQTLIKQYENVIENALLTDISVDIVDTFIGLICLQSVSQPLIYQKYNGYQALPMALDRLKRVWFYLNKLFDCRFNFHNETKKSYMTSEIESIMNEFFSQLNQSDEQHIAFSLSCAAAWKKLAIGSTSDWLEFDTIRTKNIDRYLEYQPEFNHSIIKRKLEQITQNSHPLQMFQQEPFFLLTFVPQSLQPLYYCTIVSPINNTDVFLPVVLLSHCLMFLDKVDTHDMNFYLAVLMLLPLFKKHMFENYALVLFERSKSIKFPNEDRAEFFQAMKDCTFIDQPKDWQILISMERQRISEAKNDMQNHEKDLRFFTASICLARLFQKQYHSRNNYETTNINLSTIESEEVYFAIINIFDSKLRIIALSIILDMKDPLVFDEERRDQLRLEVVSLLESLLPRLSLLMSTLLFVRCHTICQDFPVHFQHMVHVLGEKLNETFINKQTEEQEAAFIALRQLNNSELSHYLSKLAQRTENLSDLLHFNSTIFFEYFINTTSLDPSNTILLSSMYLAELAFDTQILKMYTNGDHKIEISPIKKLRQLWEDSSKYSKIITFEVATLITNYLRMSNKKEFHQIITDVCWCIKVEKRALPIIAKWLNYRKDEDLRLFAYYAALMLVIEGADIPDAIDIINEMFVNDSEFCLKNVIQHLFILRPANPIIVRQIFVTLHQNIRYSAQLSVSIHCKEILKLILTLELERITSNIHHTFKNMTEPYLLMISSCSEDLELYLKQYLLEFVDVSNNLQHNIKEEHIAIIVKWIIKMSIALFCATKFSSEFYEWIFTFLHNQRFPRVQKAIFNALNSIFIDYVTQEDHVLMQDDTIIHLEKVIYYWNTYSKDVLAVCLLAYGNCLLKLQEFQRNRNVSDEMQNVLNTLFKTSSSELISIRAAFCLIFAHRSNIKFTTISNWFENKSNITLKQTYNILLQLTLYEKWSDLFIQDIKVIVQLIDMFVANLYSYLCNKENSDYLADPMPNYVGIALQVCERYFDVFCSAVQNSSFGEAKFRKEYSLYFYQTNNSTDRKTLVQLYTAFGGVTDDLIDMLKWIEFVEDGDGWKYLEHIKQISDRDIIEKIFQCLDLVACDIKSRRFSSILKLLIQLAETDIVSLLEVHQHISSVINNFSFEDDDRKWNDEKEIFDLLLNLS
ncbi:unnamed protein product, partial [Rotaria sp. Silwood1]